MRLACALAVGERRHSGVILDLSPTGVFVQTSARLGRRERVRLELSLPGRPEPLRLEAEVVRARQVPPHLVNVAHGGIGLRLTNAPEEYFAFMARVLPAETVPAGGPATGPQQPHAGTGPQRPHAGAGSGEPEPTPVFRVRAAQRGGTRTRTLRVTCGDEQQAREAALEQLGADWKILDCAID